MAKTVNQSIPSELLEKYAQVLRPATIQNTYPVVGKRSPYSISQLKSWWDDIFRKFPYGPTPAQQAIRRRFRKSVDCFIEQPSAGGVVPPTTGARSRAWWYNAAASSGLWYYDYFIQQTMLAFKYSTYCPWCTLPNTEIAITNKMYPNTHYDGYSSFLLQNNGNSVTQLYIKASKTSNPNANFIYINLFENSYRRGTGTPHAWTWTMDAYAAAGAWNKNTLTWNNAPGKATLLGQRDMKFTFPPGPSGGMYTASRLILMPIPSEQAILAPYGYVIELSRLFDELIITYAGYGGFAERRPTLTF